MTTTVTAKITVRKGTATAWTSANPTLLSGEIGYETDTGKQKMGDGVTAWTSLAYYHDPDLAATYEAAGAVATHAAITSAVHGITAFGASLVDDTDAGTARTTLELGTAATTASSDYAVAAKGVTNGDSHDHSGGDGAQIAYSGLSGLPTLGTAAATAATDYATAAQGGKADTALQAGATASEIHAATDKATPVDADELGIVDSAASWVLKKLSWANVVARLKVALAYFNDSTNVSVGSNLLATLTTGTQNSILGKNAGSAITTGHNNCMVGQDAGKVTTSGIDNVFIGIIAGAANISGNTNVCIGPAAGNANTTGGQNTYVGPSAGRAATTSNNNAAFGWGAGRGIVSGAHNNVFVGVDAGRYHANGSTSLTMTGSSVYIGAYARGKNNSDDNSVVIGGNTPIGLGANTTVIGTSATTLTRLYGNLGLGVDSPSAAIHTIKTTEQLRLGYDATKYLSATVDATGGCTFNINGTLNALSIASSGQLIIQGDATTDLPGYGSELLTSAGWTVNTGWTESPDDTFAHTSGTGTLTHSAAITSGWKLQIAWTITGRTVGSVTVAVGGQSKASITATGTFGPTATSTDAFTITPTTDFNGTISLVSLKQITAVSTPERVIKDSAGTVICEERFAGTNISLGLSAGSSLTTGNYNNFLGASAGRSLTTGSNNNCLGFYAGYYLTTGNYNNCLGNNAGRSITTGNYNNCLGLYAGHSLTTGSSNNCLGNNTGYSLTTGSSNNCLGVYAGYYLTTGNYNNCLGYYAGYSLTTGGYNSFVGYQAGRYFADGATALTDPEYSVYIGYAARGKDNSDDNSVVIGGNTPIGLGANTTVIGTSATTLTRLFGNLGLGVDSPSAAIHTIKTTEQLRLGYDATYYASFTVSSAGNLTVTPVGGTLNIGTLNATSILTQAQILSATSFGAL